MINMINKKFIIQPINSRGWAFHNSTVTGACSKPGFEMVVTGSKDEQIIKWSAPRKGNQAKREIINRLLN